MGNRGWMKTSFETWFSKWEALQPSGQLSYRTEQGAKKAWDYQENRIKKLEGERNIYSWALIGIASKGCEFSFDDDQHICSTAPGYHHNYWCSPCLANEALEKTT